MYRCGPRFLLTLAITFVGVLALTGCLGKSSGNSGNSGVQIITLNPTGNVSLEVGSHQFFSASARDGLGHQILGLDIQFIVQSGNPNTSAPLSVARNGSYCAGTWDPTLTQCSPGTSGIAIVTATANGVSSPPTTFYVHQHVDSVQVSQAEPVPPQYHCFSQGQTWIYQAAAFSNNVDITSTVGPVTWSAGNFGVATPVSFVPPQQPNTLNQAQVTARSPGITELFATVGGATSSAFPYTTCLVRYLRLRIQGSQTNTITVNNGGSVPVTATAIDSLYNIVDFSPLAAPPITWSTTNPEVAAFGTVTNTSGTNSATARANLGGATLTASCSPPSCNIGVLPGLPIYASNGPLPNGATGFGAISVNVTTTTKAPTYTAWVATTGCADAPGCSSALFSVTPTTSGTNQIGAIVSLPRTPNSMMFHHLATSRLYIGTDQGLMFVDVAGTNPTATLVSNSSTPCHVSLCGKVLAISNNGQQVVVADNTTIPHQVYLYNASGTAGPIDLVIPNDTATAAAFSPDQLKLFILTSTGRMYVYSTVDAFGFVPIATSAADVQFAADGSFAYVVGDPLPASVSAYSTCASPTAPTIKLPATGSSALAPTKIFLSPAVTANGAALVSNLGPNDNAPSLVQTLVALEPPNIEVLQAEFTQQPAPINAANATHATCDPIKKENIPVTSPTLLTTIGSFNLGLGAFTPVFAQLVADGNEMIVVAANVPDVLLVSPTNGNLPPVQLAPGSLPLATSAFNQSVAASTDGSQVFLIANDPCVVGGPCPAVSVHIVITNGQTQFQQGDIQQVPYVNVNDNNNMNMCNQNPGAPCLPDLIAIKPQ